MTLRSTRALLTLALLASGVGGRTYAGTATNVTGLYYTGVNNSGGLLAGAAQDSHWSVTYASTNGGTSRNTAYQGNAYVVSSSYIDAGWTQNTANAQWIVPPGASTAATGGTLNVGGDYLPGNGTGSGEAAFVYTLAFTISGTGSGTVTNSVSISLTLSADDQYRVWVNNSAGVGNLPTGAAAATGTSAWNNTTAITLQNGTNGTGTSGNSVFVIGTNYIAVRVDNTNSKTGNQTSLPLNPSGLLVYQVGSATLINGVPIPEVGAWLPILSALALYGAYAWRRGQLAASISV